MLRRKLWRDLSALRGQVLTIALVIASATGGFIGSFGTYTTLLEARDAFYVQARFAQVFADVKRAPIAVLDQIKRLPEVDDAEANVSAVAQLTLANVKEPLTARLVGVPPGTGSRLNRVYLRSGRFIEQARITEALVDEGFAAARHLHPGDEVTVLLNGKREQLYIVGIGLSPEYINPSIGGAFPDPKGLGVFWIDEERLAASFDLRDAFNHLSVIMSRGASEPKLLHELDLVLERYGGSGAYGRSDQISHKIVTQEMNQQRVFGTVMPAMFVWVAAFLLNVVLARQISTQREQIAALKALGYGNSAIVFHYLGFVLIVVALGALLGVAIGEWLGRYMTDMYSKFFHFPHASFLLRPNVVGLAVGSCLVAGIAGALLAVSKVVRLSPAQAMRPPTPPRARRLIVERLGIGHWIPVAGRMIMRNMERRPMRATLTIAGIAASVALIVSGTFWWDALNYMIDFQFNRAQRSDAVISFTNPLSNSTVFEVQRLPGVTQAEPFRSVAVRLSAGQDSYRTAILGLSNSSSLRRVLDDSQHRAYLPPRGVLLSQRLAERLHLMPGDTVHVEALEGTRVQRDVLVAGITEDMFALAGYMDMHALNSLMAEPDRASAIDIRIDAGELNSLYPYIKETPQIAVLTVKRNSLASFNETSARNVLVFTSIFTVFAATIAVGVVYNSARIALAERAWELASLRVLGFSRAEVSTFLLGELAIELAAGIPLGMLAGSGLAKFLVNLMHSETFRIPVIIAPRTYVIAVSAIVLSGIASALLVRRRVDQLDLVAALKMRE